MPGPFSSPPTPALPDPPLREQGIPAASPAWEYQIPDLSKGGAWYQERVRNLHEACQGLPDRDQLIAEGLEALEIHRGNYTEEGPKYLQVLWWEFPEEHREGVRKGSTMRFLVDPGSELVPNPPLTEEQIRVVGEFVDELKSLGVVRTADRPLRRVCPIFVVPKPGQPGQWRCIADMRRGGQNSCCSLDPIYLPSSRDILPHLYEGGWSAVADASKYFHNYLTLPQERDLIGIIHPVTGEHLWYVGLPMGSVNSPSIACRIGEGFLEKLRRGVAVFQVVRTIENTWRVALGDGVYDPRIGHGYVGLQACGRPVALIFGFVDDFFIHAQTEADCRLALTAFMDFMVTLGIICQPVKTSPPAQVQKYCGFLFDTRGTPTLRIPPHKISRCQASIQFLRGRPRGARLSRLSLAVVTGVLQSIVAATPQHIGQNHLRSLYDDLHNLEEGIPITGAQKYYTVVELSRASLAALDWWGSHLQAHKGYTTCRAHSRRGIVLKWGDGSGTGTGGTTEFYQIQPGESQSPHVELWMGVWTAKSRPHTSNWKEARTVLESLLQEEAGRLVDKVVFYITDNLVSYYIINGGSSKSPELHRLVQEIKEAAAQHQCHLEVVHVPGTLMITQGTDGLSRGIWLAAERRAHGLNQSLFHPIPYSQELGLWAAGQCGYQGLWPSYLSFPEVQDWRCTLHRLTIWTPPPECGRQLLATYLRQWVQAPTTTSAIFLLPRILQREWSRVAKYIQEVGVFFGDLLPPDSRFTFALPFVVLHIPRHEHRLRPNRMDLPPKARPPRWHEQQAERVRELA